MLIKCPICNSEYEEGSVRFCKNCMYSLGTDFYLTNMLNNPSNEELRQYNQSLDEYRILWDEKIPESGTQRNEIVKMVEVKGGNFRLGMEAEESEENLTKSVTVESFSIGTTPITLGVFHEFIDETDYQTEADKEGYSYININGKMERKSAVNYKCDTQGNIRNSEENDHPVFHVSWNDAIAFCKWLNERDGLQPTYHGKETRFDCDFNSDGYRLPTEQEWEYAARGGKRSRSFKYSGSNNLYEAGWYISNSKRSTHPVAKKMPNELGIYDMSGNVWEWCWDWREEKSSSNGSNPRSHGSDSHLIRGGSWADVEEYCQVTKRYGLVGEYRYYGLGFRVVRTKK